MIVNADNFQAMILNKKDNQVKYKLTIDKNGIESTKSVKLLGIIMMTTYDLINTFQTCVPKLSCS